MSRSMDSTSEPDLNPNSLSSLSKRLDHLIISYESLHKTWPVQQPVQLENKLSVKERAEVLDQRAADNGTYVNVPKKSHIYN